MSDLPTINGHFTRQTIDVINPTAEDKLTVGSVTFGPLRISPEEGIVKTFWDPPKQLPASPVPITPSEETDPSGRPLNSPGAKGDTGKLRPWLCVAGFSRALQRVAEVTTKGAEKYTPNGWVSVPNGEERYMEAAMRHLMYLGQGEVYDNGPGGIGTKHLSQVIWNLLAVLELEERRENDSKPV